MEVEVVPKGVSFVDQALQMLHRFDGNLRG